ncbi:hypothetical protein DBV15_07179 [Temnothorax longispinosus]|uniref:Uncharacterized protein n=1 Tax=Temnothorax longispinosus TaxID=300112 RepID=A0A4S2JPQ2_9HYME|nr:hypothetical protein DBV15_07179 [Temnothorax longispinosus]
MGVCKRGAVGVVGASFYAWQAAAIYGCVSGAAGNGRPCRRTRRWAMLRSVERRRGASDENELFGCWGAIFRCRRETDRYVRERRGAAVERIDDGGEKTDEMKNRK